MVAYPIISRSVATWTQGINVLALVRNTGSSDGYVRFITNTRDSLGYDWVYAGSEDKCIFKTNNYINELGEIVYVTSPNGYVNYALIMAFPCETGSNCSTSCPTYASETSRNTNIPVSYALGVDPNPVTNLTLTPGDKSLTVNWTEPDNAPIFAYGITVYQGSTKLVGGYKSNIPFVINGLENGVLYTVNVIPVSDDYRFGTWVSKSGTPGTVCNDPQCNINITG